MPASRTMVGPTPSMTLAFAVQSAPDAVSAIPAATAKSIDTEPEVLKPSQ